MRKWSKQCIKQKTYIHAPFYGVLTERAGFLKKARFMERYWPHHRPRHALCQKWLTAECARRLTTRNRLVRSSNQTVDFARAHFVLPCSTREAVTKMGNWKKSMNATRNASGALQFLRQILASAPLPWILFQKESTKTCIGTGHVCVKENQLYRILREVSLPA